MKNKYLHLIALATAVASISGCGVQEASIKTELQAEVKNLKPSIPELPAPTVYEPYAYTQNDMVDPFSPTKISVKLLRSENSPDLNRTKEPLESFPLESIRMVGAVQMKEKAGEFEAVLNADGYMYRVRPGNYMGLNYGKVVLVKETELVLKEMYQESNGDWNSRETNLTMQDNNAGVKK